MNILLSTCIRTNLSIVPNNNYYIVGKIAGQSYYRVPKEGMLILKMTNHAACTPQKICKDLGMESEEVLSFLNEMMDLGLIMELDGARQYDLQKYKSNTIVTKVVNFLFCRVTFIAVIGCLAGLLIFSHDFRHLVVRNNVLIFEQYPGINLFIVTIISVLLTSFHELGHYLAAKKYEVPVKFNLSTRLYILVIEAKMNGIWSVSRESRYVPLLGGMYFDLISGLLCAFIIEVGSSTILDDMFSTAIILIVTQFLFQFAIFFRTDLYFIVVNFLQIDGLQSRVKDVLRGRKTERFAIAYTMLAFIGTLTFMAYFIFIFFNSVHQEVQLFYYNLVQNDIILKLDSIMGLGVIGLTAGVTFLIILKRIMHYMRSTRGISKY
ncbi:hypothetical protein [Lactiplantibacillus plantarum]|uniref:hypothetical protein n=1 Tax=Lactiplantibacillus plantarum TaxID=1590 RepID=UPI0009412D09|nr:hypothetical protein [Lactiplantibacillus plantarum]MBC6384220.1 hypothetical protein [Lactiplantibacillus plantarum]